MPQASALRIRNNSVFFPGIVITDRHVLLLCDFTGSRGAVIQLCDFIGSRCRVFLLRDFIGYRCGVFQLCHFIGYRCCWFFFFELCSSPTWITCNTEVTFQIPHFRPCWNFDASNSLPTTSLLLIPRKCPQQLISRPPKFKMTSF